MRRLRRAPSDVPRLSDRPISVGPGCFLPPEGSSLLRTRGTREKRTISCKHRRAGPAARCLVPFPAIRAGMFGLSSLPTRTDPTLTEEKQRRTVPLPTRGVRAIFACACSSTDRAAAECPHIRRTRKHAHTSGDRRTGCLLIIRRSSQPNVIIAYGVGLPSTSLCCERTDPRPIQLTNFELQYPILYAKIVLCSGAER
jgi:hypothetical protein